MAISNTLLCPGGGVVNAFLWVYPVCFSNSTAENILSWGTEHSRRDLRAWGAAIIASQIAWMLLVLANHYTQFQAGDGWEQAGHRFRAKAFIAFGVQVDQVPDQKTSLPLFFLVTLLPATVVGFLVFW